MKEEERGGLSPAFFFFLIHYNMNLERMHRMDELKFAMGTR